MTDPAGPWRRKPTEPAPRSYLRLIVWLALVAAGALGIWELSLLFPGSLADPMDQGYFLRLCAILVMMAAGVVYSRRFGWREGARNVAIWAAIAAVLVFGYTFYHRIADAADDARSELVPGYPATVGASAMVLSENRDGDFFAIGSVNGATVRFLVDTGASDIVLSPGDAERIGIDTSTLRFNRTTETANGEGRGAPYTVDRLEIGPVKLFNVPVSINQAPMHSSLLGMTFLKQMKSFEMKGRKLYLRWR